MVYDYEKMIEHLMDSSDTTYEEAVEFIDYYASYPVPNHPIILVRIDDYVDYAENSKA